jgi:Tol biopolymer transport system component
MRLAIRNKAAFECALLIISTGFQAGAQQSTRPDIVLVTPNTIRIQSLDNPADGNWVVMPGFAELGSPTFSRDGQWIAFDGYKDGFDNSRAECWIARRDGRELKRLAFGATPRFSPDGRQLLFVREGVNDRTLPEGVYVINRDGSGEKRIGPGRWPDWSPDGTSIVFSLGGEETGGARIGSTICIAKSDGSDRRELIEGDCPSWSPDGKKIAYCYRTRGRAPMINVYDLEENANAALGIGWYRANWMPDSKSAVANGLIDQERVMVRLFLNRPRKVIAQSTEYEDPHSPSVSWGGKEIVFIARKPGSH